MADVVRVGDSAGGAIQNSRNIGVTINGVAVAVQGDGVSSHPPCPNIISHCSASMTASTSVTINGIDVCVNGDPASCGHSASASSQVDIS